jgi:uncharacterized membrane protein
MIEMGILNIFGKKDSTTAASAGPTFNVSTELFPYRLQARKSSSAVLQIKVKNLTKDVVLTSVVAEVPNQLGFDEMILSKQKQVKVGEIQPGEEKDVRINLYTSLKSDPGNYTLMLTTTAHYRDYTHVLNDVRKRVAVELV